MKKTVIVNIGLETSYNFGTPMELEADVVVEFLRLHGVDAVASKVEQSNTEQTLVATLEMDSKWLESELYELSYKLEQDCIAYYVVEEQKGYLVGEYAEEWGGEFLAEFFMI